MPRYPKPVPGEALSVRWSTERLRLRCCDCGLVHDVVIDIHGDVATLRFWRDDRATTRIRRRAPSLCRGCGVRSHRRKDSHVNRQP